MTSKKGVSTAKGKKGETHFNYDPDSIENLWKRACEAGDYDKSFSVFRKATKSPIIKGHQLVMYLIQKHTIGDVEMTISKWRTNHRRVYSRLYKYISYNKLEPEHSLTEILDLVFEEPHDSELMGKEIYGKYKEIINAN